MRLSPAVGAASLAARCAASESDDEADADAVPVPSPRARSHSPPQLLRLSPWRQSGAEAFFAPPPSAAAVPVSAVPITPPRAPPTPTPYGSARHHLGAPPPQPATPPQLAPLPLSPVGARLAGGFGFARSGDAPAPRCSDASSASSGRSSACSAAAFAAAALAPASPPASAFASACSSPGASAARAPYGSEGDIFGAFDDDVWTPGQLPQAPPSALPLPPPQLQPLPLASELARLAVAREAAAVLPPMRHARRHSYYADDDDLDGGGGGGSLSVLVGGDENEGRLSEADAAYARALAGPARATRRSGALRCAGSEDEDEADTWTDTV